MRYLSFQKLNCLQKSETLIEDFRLATALINLVALSRTFSVLLSRDKSVCLVARHGLVLFFLHG
ncbi:hypothetical protein PMIT1313_00990 [Prochlorococcus marinus str. MIT 1313]|nr:hypothetical protein PMIT1313_00990 [Prochlorococcus marinus str. MIT 1313]KZR72228.1 hypothetical protein PMIT1318_01288 [Prochlorococcus marinus str. MIT 1318]